MLLLYRDVTNNLCLSIKIIIMINVAYLEPANVVPIDTEVGVEAEGHLRQTRTLTAPSVWLRLHTGG